MARNLAFRIPETSHRCEGERAENLAERPDQDGAVHGLFSRQRPVGGQGLVGDLHQRRPGRQRQLQVADSLEQQPGLRRLPAQLLKRLVGQVDKAIAHRAWPLSSRQGEIAEREDRNGSVHAVHRYIDRRIGALLHGYVAARQLAHVRLTSASVLN